ncbi:hypothetical protein GCM10010468_54690 [Actinocorallia longicatena]|uniref:SsuA/THI5-like domain-containing protein n=1 Tax=Actinocorallia longicatena TaxID=111803 RepID=A0ABP6QJ51_9ACTN
MRIALIPAAPPSLPLIAEKNGGFTAQGLKVKISALPSTSITTFAPGLGRQYDIAWGTPADVIAASAQGHDITVIAGAYLDSTEHSQAQIFAAKAGRIASLAGLKGKRIATPSLSGTLYLSVLTSLKKAGVDAKDVTLVEVPFPTMLDQLNAGRVDAVATIQPFIGALKGAGHTALGDPFLSVASPAVAGMWIAGRSWAEKNPKKVASFVAALDAADTWVAAHDQEARTFLTTALKLPPQVMAVAPLPDWDSSISPEALTPWIDAVSASGQVNGTLPKPSDLVGTAGKNG